MNTEDFCSWLKRRMERAVLRKLKPSLPLRIKHRFKCKTRRNVRLLDIENTMNSELNKITITGRIKSPEEFCNGEDKK